VGRQVRGIQVTLAPGEKKKYNNNNKNKQFVNNSLTQV
jgi:hypothetical protein